ncbi:DUF4255 domain-containing protein [Bacillus toyonensis]|uniref:DUF4255 domain-containing protein n=1 Tax=Bacillus toyonensis TaxID=155322 RepID=UPI001C019906|nr:DUF4255 domain-containing protein [Bacillus toyonensis]QWH88415.1 DUF4255 domain-containing protein [Bacillus toyonensis]QWI31590.1 DUF4255 domain-containing protein [Bacillus toyonensis]
MSSENVIADVGITLVKLLEDNMSDLKGSIALLSPADEVSQNIHLALSLYHIVENIDMKNQENSYIGTTQLQYPPLVLNLHYLLTAHSSNPDITERNLEEHKIIGRVMRIFYDNPVLTGSILKGGLAESEDQLRLTLNSMSLTEIMNIWQVIPNKHFKPSVSYMITPIRIDSARKTTTKRVLERELNYSQFEVKK